jgi:hypothetical protein
MAGTAGIGVRVVPVLRGWLAAYAVPLQVFVITRLGLELLTYFGLIFIPVAPDVRRAYPSNLWLDGWVRWDAGWYFSIVSHGYTTAPQNAFGQTNTAFFPLYPLVIWLAKHVIGQHPFITGLIVSNAAFLGALILLYRLVGDHYGRTIATRTLILLAIFPFAFYFSTMYSESLFLLAVVAAFFFGERQRWLLAGLCAAAAGATRLVGVLTILGLAVLYLEHVGFRWRKVRMDILWLLVGFVGPGAFMAYLAVHTGDPLQFAKAQLVPHWLRDLGPARAWATLTSVFSRYALLAGAFPAMHFVHLLLVPPALLLAVACWRRPRVSYAVWAVATLIAALPAWHGTGRYVATTFPLFIVAALLLQDERRFQVVAFMSILFLALFTLVFTHGYWVA